MVMTPLLVSLVGIFSAATLGLAAPVNELAIAKLPRSPAKELTLELCEAAARYGFVPYMIECRGINKVKALFAFASPMDLVG